MPTLNSQKLSAKILVSLGVDNLEETSLTTPYRQITSPISSATVENVVITSLSNEDNIVGESLSVNSLADNHLQVTDQREQSVSVVTPYNITGTSGDDYLIGTPQDDYIDGGSGNDYIDGGSGNDHLINGFYIDGGDGDDYIYGGEEDGQFASPRLFGGRGNDTLLSGNSNFFLEGGEGSDYIDATTVGGFLSYNFSPAAVHVDLSTNEARGGDATGDTILNFDNVFGSHYDDVLVGNNNNNFLGGGDCNDYLFGAAGDDTLDGSARIYNDFIDPTSIDGNDTLLGGDGNDKLLGGTGDDNLFGGTGDDLLVGDTGDDNLFGDTGNDTLLSGDGNDNLFGGNGNDNLLSGNGDDNLFGEEGDDTLFGGTGDDNLFGDKGTDTAIYQGTMSEYFVDYLAGGEILIVTDGVPGRDGTDTLFGVERLQFSDQTITLRSSPVISISANETVVEGLTSLQTVSYTVTLSSASSQLITVDYATADNTALADLDYTSIFGTLTFAPGVISQVIDIPILNDYLNEPDETFTLSLTSPTNATLGNDSISTTTITDTLLSPVLTDEMLTRVRLGTLTLPDNVENLTLIGRASMNGAGNSGNNVITGNVSNNILSGGLGVDTLIGGMGNDTYIVDSTTDTIIEEVNQGKDTVCSSVTFTLGNNLENLNLTETEDINGTGNSSNNVIIGNSGNNIITGAGGQDALTGGAGVDRFNYQTLADSLLSSYDLITDFNATAGNDLFLVSTARTDFKNIGNISLLNTAVIAAASTSNQLELSRNKPALNSFQAAVIAEVLTADNFGVNSAVQFSIGRKTFVAINNDIAGFDVKTDAIIQLTGLTGNLSLANFTTV